MAGEDRMAEAEVTLRLAEYLLELPEADSNVEVALDGAAVKVGTNEIFPITSFLSRQGWVQTRQEGNKNPWSGIYQRNGKKLRIHSRPGKADVAVQVGERRLIAECKKGPLIRKRGSPERPILAGALGQALLWMANEDDLVVVAVPDTEQFRRLAEEWRERPLLKKTGIQICLVSQLGSVTGLTL